MLFRSDHLDHLVLTTSRETACVDFYTRVLGMQLESFVGGTPPVTRRAFKFGNQKINLHVQGAEFEPKAHLPVPGALDLCFLADRPLNQVIAHLKEVGWPILEGPVLRVERAVSQGVAHAVSAISVTTGPKPRSRGRTGSVTCCEGGSNPYFTSRCR